MKKKICLVYPSLIFLLSATSSFANVGAEFGMGSKSASLAGSSVAWDLDGFAGYVNPAALPIAGQDSEKPASRFIFSYGLIYMNPSFKSIDNVLVENKYVSTQDTTGSVDTSYPHTLGQEIGAVFKAFPDFLNLSFGVTAYFPLDQLSFVDTGAALQPEYFLERDRTQVPQLDLSMGGNISESVHFGIGLHTAYTLTGLSQNFLNTDNGPSTGRFSASIKPKMIPFFGLLFSPSSDFSTGAVVRLAASSDSTVNITSGAQVVGNVVPFSFAESSTLLYEPLSIEWGTSFKTSQDFRTYAQVDYQLWGKFKPPGLVIQNGQFCTDSTQCGVNIQPGPSYDYGYRNIVIPRIGEEIAVGTTLIRVGYAYQPSILKDPPDGAGNYLDPPKHLFNIGTSLEFQHFLGYDTPWRLDLNASWQLLVTQTITKTSGNEAGDATDAKIGSPNYDAGGSIYGGGASVTFAF